MVTTSHRFTTRSPRSCVGFGPRTPTNQNADNNGDWIERSHTPVLNAAHDSVDQICASVLPILERAVAARFRHADSDWVHDAAVDALLEYATHPQTYDPSRGVPLWKWLVYPARRNLLNRVKSEYRRRSVEIYASNVERLEPATDDRLEHGLDLNDLKAKMFHDWSAAERKILLLWISGERRTARFAEAIGADTLTSDRQRIEVKRLKDRVLRRLRRLGTSL